MSWTPALRIARRGVRRNLGRSLLIAALIAIPVAGATLVDVLARTLSAPAREAERTLGTADAQVGAVGPFKRLVASAAKPKPADFRQYLPAGTRVVPAPVSRPIILARDHGRLVLSQTDAPSLPGAFGHVMIMGVSSAVMVSADPREPMHRQATRVAEGRAPRSASEVLVTKHLAQRLGITIGASIRAQSRTLTVTGISTSPFCLSCDQLVALPDPKAAADAYLIDLPDGTDKDALWRTLETHHIGLYTREDGALSEPESVNALRAAAMVTMIAGFGLLEVILLAGSAFAVGARRQTRTLGLVAASGGTPRDVRRIVLAEGLVLGLLGALAGAAVGVLVAVALHGTWVALDDAEIAHFVFRPLEIGAAILVGTLAGLVAAAAPAIGAARMKPVDALAGRFRISGAVQRRTVAIGLALLAGGVVSGLLGNALLHSRFTAYETALAKIDQTGATDLPQVTTPGPAALILLGATLLAAAVVTLTPIVIGRLARVGGALPVAGRLAVRDAARHRHRTGPATSAIAVAVAGSVLVACIVAATNKAELLEYVAALPEHTIAIEPSANAKPAAQAAAKGLPGARTLSLTIPLGQAPAGLPPDAPATEGRGLRAEAACATPPCDQAGDPLALGDAQGIAAAALVGANANEVRAQLAKGRVVLFGAPGTGGPATVTIHAGLDDVQVPGYVAERPQAYLGLPTGLMPASVAHAHGWDDTGERDFVSYGAQATSQQVDAALQRAQAKGAYARIETPPDVPSNTILLIVVIGAAFITLAGAAISIALSAAEGRADLATLAAVGAPPRRRRALAAAQALLIAGVGCVLGVLAGTFVAYTLRATTGAPGFIVPWANLGATAIIVPLLATLIAATFTPSRLPLVRRAA
jgi:putative ABC transport system permease protein